MRDLKSRGYLGELNARLQRLLGFDGEAGGTFISEARPVLVCGDATLPGYGATQLRRFVVGGTNTIADANYWYIKATQDVIIQELRLTILAAVAGTAILYTIDPSVAEPGGAPAIGGVFLDRAISGDDRPPIKFQVTANAAVGKVYSTHAWTATQLGRQETILEVPFCLAAGASMSFVVSGAGTSALLVARGMTL